MVWDYDDLVMQSDALANLMASVDQLYFVVMGILCLFGVLGCAMMESGISRAKNSLVGITKNVASLALSVCLYWLFGYSFSDFWEGNGFLGYQHFGGHGIDMKESGEMFFFACVVALVVSFVSRAISERITIIAHLIFSAVLAGFAFPMVAHWVWSAVGWLHSGTEVDNGGKATFLDHAGSSAIHIMVGCIIIAGLLMVGERVKKRMNSSLVNASIGGLMTIVSIFALHAGLRRSISQTDEDGEAEGFDIGTSALNTIAAGSAGAGTTLIIARLYKGKWDVLAGINGFLTGQISVAAGVYAFYPGVAFVVGVISSFSYLLWVQIAKRLVDDPLKAFAVHFGGGLWGIFAAPLMIRWDSLFYDFSFYHFQIIGWNVLGAFVIIIWSVALFGLLFACMRMCNILKISKEAVKDGLDAHYHGKKATIKQSRHVEGHDRRSLTASVGRTKTKRDKKKAKSKRVKAKVEAENVYYNAAAGADATVDIKITKSGSSSSSSDDDVKIKSPGVTLEFGGGVGVDIEARKTDSSSSSSTSHNAKANATVNVVFGSDKGSSSSSSDDGNGGIGISGGIGGGIGISVSGGKKSGSDSSSSSSHGGGIGISGGIGVDIDVGGVSGSSSSSSSHGGGIGISGGIGVDIDVGGSGSESSSSSSSSKSGGGGIGISLSGGGGIDISGGVDVDVDVGASGSGSDSSSHGGGIGVSGGIGISIKKGSGSSSSSSSSS